MWHDLLIWWRGGELLMPIMLTVALILYTVLGERLWALLGPPSRSLIGIDRRTAELELTRGLGLIRVLAGILPLLGLLGTVSGMIDTFAHLSHDAEHAGNLGDGVALALTATQYGLALAIPAGGVDWLLRRRATRLMEGA